MKKLLILTVLLLSIPVAFAHIPEIVTENRNYTLEPVIVTEPEISYAYYGKLQGSPQVYKIESNKPFHLYVSLLVPYVGQEETSDVEFHIMKDGEKIVMMHDYQNWTKWYEEYGRDWYLQGPTYEADVEAGIYLVEVHSDTNTEDYSLAIGNIERFPTLRKMNAYLGLVPRQKDSGGKSKPGHITRESRKLTRTLLTQSIYHVSNASTNFRKFYVNLTERRGAGRARIALIRKLCGVMRRMLLTGECFRYMKDELFERKLRAYEKELESFKREKEAA